MCWRAAALPNLRRRADIAVRAVSGSAMALSRISSAAGGGAGDYAHGLAIDVELEAVIADSDCDDLAGVDHADVDALGGDHDGAALGGSDGTVFSLTPAGSGYTERVLPPLPRTWAASCRRPRCCASRTGTCSA
jgi:hypothetical protein